MPDYTYDALMQHMRNHQQLSRARARYWRFDSTTDPEIDFLVRVMGNMSKIVLTERFMAVCPDRNRSQTMCPIVVGRVGRVRSDTKNCFVVSLKSSEREATIRFAKARLLTKPFPAYELYEVDAFLLNG